MALGDAAKSNRATVAQSNPYPAITLFLALYYNEVHHYDDGP
jgi:hypothetical protein